MTAVLDLMERRHLLQLMAGVVLSGVPRPGRAAPQRVVIAGGGIIGASIAMQLARRGAEVTLLERAEPGAGATSKSFAWLNSTFSKRPRGYFELNRLGMAGWRELDQELDALDVTWGGSIEWYADAKSAATLREEVRSHQGWGYGTRLVDQATLARLEPRVTTGPVEAAAHSEQEGHVDPLHALRTFLDTASRHGATVRTGWEVTGLDRRDGRLRAVTTSQGDVPADALVVACGIDTARVAALAGVRVPLKESPGVLVHTAPMPRTISRVVLSPGAHMKQKPDGRVVSGSGFGGTPSRDTSTAAGRDHLVVAARYLEALGGAEVEKVTLGFRPLPQDDLPIIGPPRDAPFLYLAVMHSGMTLAPLVGRVAAVELLDGVEVDLLQPYRLGRFD